jgi:hypothetical protein
VTLIYACPGYPLIAKMELNGRLFESVSIGKGDVLDR